MLDVRRFAISVVRCLRMRHVLVLLALLALPGQSLDAVSEVTGLDRDLFIATWRAYDGTRERTVTDSYIFTTPAGGKLTKAEWKALVATTATPHDQFRVSEQKVRVHENIIYIDGYVELLFEVKGGLARNEYRYTNAYFKLDGQWRRSHSTYRTVMRHHWKLSLRPEATGAHCSLHLDDSAELAHAAERAQREYVFDP